MRALPRCPDPDHCRPIYVYAGREGESRFCIGRLTPPVRIGERVETHSLCIDDGEKHTRILLNRADIELLKKMLSAV